MLKFRFLLLMALFFGMGICSFASTAPVSESHPHKNFKVTIYIPEEVVEHLGNPQWRESSWSDINSQVKVDKVYIETYRSGHVASDALLDSVKKFFVDHGVQVAGGIAFSAAEDAQFLSICYTDPKARAYVRNISELTARHFNEIILDDFFFNNTKNDSDIAAKGAKSWSQFRLGLMDGVASDLIVGAARSVNPKVKVVIKFPNWYEHFQGLGYDLAQEPKIFSGIYTGTETRDPVITDQHLQQYESYQIYRYFENIDPGKNGGGWVDTFDIRYIDRYSEELWDTLFAKAPEITLFNWAVLMQPVTPGDRLAWQSLPTTFRYEDMLAWHKKAGLTDTPDMASVAGYSLALVDPVVGRLGHPIGIASYKPYQSSGEDFLHNYLGMIGIPIDLYPTFPTEAQTVLLTESASYDPQIVAKIKAQLQAGKNVVITSGLLRALQGHGIEDIVQMRDTGRKLSVQDYWSAYGAGGGANLGAKENPPVLVPEIQFMTNDAWPVVRGTANGHGAPLLLMDRYSKGILYVLTIPDNFNDLYLLPQPVLTSIKSYLMRGFPLQMDAPSRVSLFVYDNRSFVIESFRDVPAQVSVQISGNTQRLRNLATGDVVQQSAVPLPVHSGKASQQDQRTRFQITLQPHSFAAFTEE